MSPMRIYRRVGFQSMTSNGLRVTISVIAPLAIAATLAVAVVRYEPASLAAGEEAQCQQSLRNTMKEAAGHPDGSLGRLFANDKLASRRVVEVAEVNERLLLAKSPRFT